MTPEKQQIAIAMACPSIAEIDKSNGGIFWKAHDPFVQFDPLNDLNAMHEAYLILNSKQRSKFAEELAYIVLGAYSDPQTEFVFSRCSLALFANAIAAKRAEAFLRALGLWEDETK